MEKYEVKKGHMKLVYQLEPKTDAFYGRVQGLMIGLWLSVGALKHTFIISRLWNALIKF